MMKTLPEVIATINEGTNELRRELASALNTLTSTPFVVGFPENGIYIKAITENGNVVRTVNTCGLSIADRFSRADAFALCEDGNIRNGHGEIAIPVVYVAALRNEIARRDSLVNELLESN
jgi:hypothetical protein